MGKKSKYFDVFEKPLILSRGEGKYFLLAVVVHLCTVSQDLRCKVFFILNSKYFITIFVGDSDAVHNDIFVLIKSKLCFLWDPV